MRGPKQTPVAVTLLAVGAAAWIMTLRLSAHMPSHPGAFVTVWTLMMVAMMAPSVLPTVLVFATSSTPAASSRFRTSLFVSGYFLSWAGLGAIVALGQRVVQPLVASWARPLAAGALVLAGLYQLTAWKKLCLTHCRTPLHFFLQHWRPGVTGALVMGAHHGLYCVGCCIGLMTALVVLGMMTPLWMVTIAVVVALEKMVPQGDRLALSFGVAIVVAGIAVAAGWVPVGMPRMDAMPMEGMPMMEDR